jgi:DNA-binding response OmpR family regulator
MPEQHAVIVPDRQRALHVLLIEDDEGDAYLVQRVFEISAVNVQLLVLHESKNVLLFLRNQMTSIQFPRPDLILLDLYLAQKDGFSLLRDIKPDRTLSDIPVVIVTNSMRDEDMILCYQEHASGYISKSFDFDEFTHKIDVLVRSWSQTVVLPNRQQRAVADSPSVVSSTFALQDYGTGLSTCSEVK